MLKELEDPFYKGIIDNIIRIANERNITRAALSEYIGISQSQMSKVLKRDVSLSIVQLSNLATGLNMKFVDIITYPDRYVLANKTEEPIDAVVQIKLRGEKKEQVLKLVLGENCEEILNK